MPEWEKLASKEFLDGDFCSIDYLLENWDKINGWILYTQDAKWAGCSFISKKHHDFNSEGIHFLEGCIFPEFRGKGYGKYLMKINFDHAIGYRKSVCINPLNKVSISLCAKYGFKTAGFYKNWIVFICEEDYPPELKNIKLSYMETDKILSEYEKLSQYLTKIEAFFEIAIKYSMNVNQVRAIIYNDNNYLL